MIEIDLSRTVFDIVTEYPEVKEIMYDLGFKKIVNPALLRSAGRYVTLPKGAKMQKIDPKLMQEAFAKRGYLLKGEFK